MCVSLVGLRFTGFPHVLENNTFIFQVLEMSLNFTKSGRVLEKILSEKIHLRTKEPLNKYYTVEGNGYWYVIVISHVT